MVAVTSRLAAARRAARLCEPPLNGTEFLQVGEEVGIGLGDAAGILDDDARYFEADQRHAHGHAVVVVGLDLGAAQTPRHDAQPVPEPLPDERRRGLGDREADPELAPHRAQRGRRGVQPRATLVAEALAVLVNGFTASASEITAAAIQESGAGAIIGTRTFGKGVVQNIYPLPDGSAIKITTARYLTPSGRDINKVGIEPDISAPNVKDSDIGNLVTDTQLQRAITYITDRVEASRINGKPYAKISK